MYYELLVVLMWDIYPVFNLSDVSNNIVWPSSSIPPVHMQECLSRTKKWTCWVIGCGSDILLYSALLSSERVYKFAYLSKSICPYPLDILYSRLFNFLPSAFNLSCIHTDPLRLNRYDGLVASVGFTSVGLMQRGVRGSML